ncbi:MAG: copper resistance system multicopper oxidase [Alphaproteobacteria bacterium]|jgi:FtsP/CotA-like multicopper oxidase with cupredoxin domain|nr:copper resistance system multicopper oxidase [Alphaproteobacteria bacterium]
MKYTILILSGLWLLFMPFQAQAEEYSLTIAREPVNITGNSVKKITVNGTIPGPTLRFQEGEEVTIHVTNKMHEDTSVHWHGLLLPGEMDGVPGFNGFPGIRPGETFAYHFKIRQAGTYWYHAHSMGQEQDGHYGSIVIAPKGKDPVQADRDYVVLLSDFTDEESGSIMANLKMSSDYYQYARRTVGDFFADAKEDGFGKAWKNAKMWGEMRMLPTDLSDVTGYTFLTNGKTPEQNWTGIFKPGERVRLRFINASAMSFYDVRIPGLKMQVVSADGQYVEPVPVDEFRFGVAETYDVIVTPKDDKAYTIAAEPIDRTGFALGTLAPREGMKGDIPEARPRALLTMADMGMAHDMSGMDHSKMSPEEMEQMMEDMRSGWAKAGTLPGDKALSYADLRYLGIQKDTRQPEREILVRLGGNMERYIWTINGKKYADSGPINLNYGERVRLKFVNDTMMAHPMHLHGMFVQLDNGQPAEKLPNKHTVIVPPGQSYSVLLTADEAGEWAFHCHLLYHMMAGMMNKVIVAKLDPSAVPPVKKSDPHAGHKMPAKQEKPVVDHSTMDHSKMGHDMPAMDHSKMDHSGDKPANEGEQHHGH